MRICAAAVIGPSRRRIYRTQEFFIRVLEGRYLDRADPEKGQFRFCYFELVENFCVADKENRNRARKRGGGNQFARLNSRPAKRTDQREPAHDETPERIFERRWAL